MTKKESSRKTSISTLGGLPAAEAIYKFSAEMNFDAVPEAVLHDAKRLLLIGIACSIMGQRWQENKYILKPMGIIKDSGSCTVFGADFGVGCTDAVFLNAVHAQVHDCNDGISGRGAWHAGRVLIPAACGVAEHMQTTGKDLLVALILGYEVAHRAYVKVRRCRCEGIGLTAMVGKLLALPREQFIHGIYLADQHSSHLYPGPDNIYASANQICSAMISRTAVESAFLAEAGITADPVGTKLGFENDLPQKANPLSFLTSLVYIKPYIACRYLHCAIEGALAFRESERKRVKDIEKVEVQVVQGPDFAKQHLQPGNYYKIGQFSIPYTVACALLFGEVGELQFTREYISSKEVQQLQKKVTVRMSPEDAGESSQYATDVTITLKDGRQFFDSREHAKGSPEAPLTDAELISQFNKWAGDSIDQTRREEIVDLVFSVETLDNVKELLKLLKAR
jgi:2-methylcitrate dehydratase PrpD